MKSNPNPSSNQAQNLNW